ncbi:MAG: hypothetical protein F4Y82_00035 [Cenarchaeum sp. SB0665_bin_23]|nr:hypothetical protein [Cenarchaeum sp. SB0665_bin_23]MYB46926.1 hypothetical protein [Cenarchaeum sp. SB0662_bin_33]MYG33153.1 hypothetical protein [Cenarchaeum sp. SB0677_bin_16]
MGDREVVERLFEQLETMQEELHQAKDRREEMYDDMIEAATAFIVANSILDAQDVEIGLMEEQIENIRERIASLLGT